jgi:O-antigen ligase
MTRAHSPAPPLLGALWLTGLGSLAVITLSHPGATRMHAWPWSLAFAAALACPVLILILRAFDPRRPLATPSRAWTWAMVGAAGMVLASAVASPHRAASLPWSTPLLAAAAHFLAVFDWLHAQPELAPQRRQRLFLGMVAGLAVVAAVGLIGWLRQAGEVGWAAAVAARNAFPLGHANYTAGLALLLLPGAAALALTGRGAARIAGSAALALGLATLFSSGSRGGILGLAALLAATLMAAPIPWRRKLLLGVAAALAAALFIVANPRTRALFAADDPAAAPNPSNVQRAAMLTAGLRMGLERPILGWGPGTTPLAFPRFRAGLEGGVENALQLHSTPVQLWAELGAAGVIATLALLVLAAGAAARQPTAAVALAGYAAFACFDWQLDVPVFALTVASLAALLAPTATGPAPGGKLAGGLALAGFGLVALLGRGDPTPELNTRALSLAAEGTPEARASASALLQDSLALNPDQEIAHFNLGWLLVTSDPARASRHFRAAARLVPDKGGVYFGLGLALLHAGRPPAAAQAFALECLNDPAFLGSPWWHTPGVAEARDAGLVHLQALLRQAGADLPPGTWAARQVPLVAAAATRPLPPPGAPERSYQRERTGYPVLMRNLDLAPPRDVWRVRESAIPPEAGAAVLPAKGWLPSPRLLALLDAAVPPGP